MSVTKIDDFTHMVECDFCEFSEDIETNDDWSVLMSEMKERGWWKIKDKDTGKWDHKCPTCVEKGKRDYYKNKADEATTPEQDEPPLDAYENERPRGSGPTPANEPPESVIFCLKYPKMRVRLSDCERCSWHNGGYGCTFGSDGEDPF